MITNGAIDRAVVDWINDGAGKSSVKNTLAVLVRVIEQAKRDGLRIDNPAQVRGWQKLYAQIEDELMTRGRWHFRTGRLWSPRQMRW